MRTVVPLANTRITSRVIGAGSRLVVVVNVNTTPAAQLNYGSGKDVSDETIADAGAPLRVNTFGASVVRIPLLK